MRKISVACIWMILVGCATQPRLNILAPEPDRQEEIRRVIAEVFNAAKQKDLDRLDGYHLYGPKFTKFDDFEPLTRQDADTARKGEREGIASIEDLRMDAQDLKIDVFGDVAVATFILDYGFRFGADTIATKARSTLVFVRDRGAWRIAHEHHSAFKPNP